MNYILLRHIETKYRVAQTGNIYKMRSGGTPSRVGRIPVGVI